MLNSKRDESRKKVFTEFYVSEFINDLIHRIEDTGYKKICLCGFNENMKWLSRLLDERFDISLSDTREEYINYDCGNKIVKNIFDLELNNYLIVITAEEPSIIKQHIDKIYPSNIRAIPLIYDSRPIYNPLRQDQPYKQIITGAEKRALSMITDQQLFDLIQLIKMTKNIVGNVVEYGSLHGGSGAVLAEALSYYGLKDLFLFDTFAGIPNSSYGVDWRWTNSFANNSYSQVCNAFKDLSNVKVVKGNIKETHKTVDGPFSFAYIASDTIESGIYLMDYIWPRLSKGGIVHTCDYGSYPNCLPLTTFLERFESDNSDVQSFRTSKCGIYFVKN